jgi:hypothetical protein
MWCRVALIALLMVVLAAGSGTAEFSTPSLDQWGDGAERVLPREQAAAANQLAAGRHAGAVWVAPTSIALVSGAPVALQNLPSNTTTTVAAGEEMILRSPYTRQVEVYQASAAPVYYYPPAARYDPPAVSYRPAAVTVYPVYAPAPSYSSAQPAAASYEVYRTQSTWAPAVEATDVRVIEMPASSAVDVRTASSEATLSPGTVHIIRESTYITYPATVIR